MSSFISVLPPRVCQSMEEKELQGPPDPRQRFLDMNLLIRREITLKWRGAKAECPGFKHHPPQRRPTAIHPSVHNIPATSKCWTITKAIPWAEIENTLTYLSVFLQTRLLLFEGGLPLTLPRRTNGDANLHCRWVVCRLRVRCWRLDHPHPRRMDPCDHRVEIRGQSVKVSYPQILWGLWPTLHKHIQAKT